MGAVGEPRPGSCGALARRSTDTCSREITAEKRLWEEAWIENSVCVTRCAGGGLSQEV